MPPRRQVKGQGDGAALAAKLGEKEGKATSLRGELLELVRKWRRSSWRKFQDAEFESDEPAVSGKRFIKHGAMCYFNCFTDLEAVLEKRGWIPAAEKTVVPGRSKKRPA